MGAVWSLGLMILVFLAIPCAPRGKKPCPGESGGLESESQSPLPGGSGWGLC